MYKPRQYKSNLYKSGCLSLLIFFTFFVAACSGQIPPTDVKVEGNEEFGQRNITLENGRVISCLFWKSGQGQPAIGGMSCDWETE